MYPYVNTDRIKQYFSSVSAAIKKNNSFETAGTITHISGLKIEVIGLSAPVNTLCKILVSESHFILAEVIAFRDEITYLMAIENIDGIKQGTPVVALSTQQNIVAGMSLLGRVLDATGNPIDKKGPLLAEDYYSLRQKLINPLERKKITAPLDVGIKAINALLTVGKGQRIGIFAGSGVGKSVLLGMMSRFTDADVVVVGLIGERGREVKEFIEEILEKQGLNKSVVIASPSDTSPLMRVKGAILATTLAEYYRDKGLDVLLIIDSLTRYAQAQREISLLAGELPATKGFTPSVFGKLSQLVERSGNGSENQGSITAFYTVLVEGDDFNDPIGDHARSILDGHIVLSRSLADSGHYPAIDIERSISRVMPSIVGSNHVAYANKFKNLYSSYVQNRELINVGMYHHGTDKKIDEAIKYSEKLEIFLKQSIHEHCDMRESIKQFYSIFSNEGLDNKQ